DEPHQAAERETHRRAGRETDEDALGADAEVLPQLTAGGELPQREDDVDGWWELGGGVDAGGGDELPRHQQPHRQQQAGRHAYPPAPPASPGRPRERAAGVSGLRRRGDVGGRGHGGTHGSPPTARANRGSNRVSNAARASSSLRTSPSATRIGTIRSRTCAWAGPGTGSTATLVRSVSTTRATSTDTLDSRASSATASSGWSMIHCRARSYASTTAWTRSGCSAMKSSRALRTP